MKRIIRRYELTDAEWERLQSYFPERQLGDKGRPRRKPREILKEIPHNAHGALTAEFQPSAAC